LRRLEALHLGERQPQGAGRADHADISYLSD
jgi:hypothetical protein